MTRLIDADDFRDEWLWQGQEYSPQDIIEEIDDAPTIEAIPLSFIREEIERLDKCKLKDTADYLREVMKYYDAVQRGDETW